MFPCRLQEGSVLLHRAQKTRMLGIWVEGFYNNQEHAMSIFPPLSRPKSTLRFLVLALISFAAFSDMRGADKASAVHSPDRALLNSMNDRSDRPDKPGNVISTGDNREKGTLGLAAPVFIENKGQFDERVKFRVLGSGASIWLTKGGIIFDFLRGKTPQPKASSPIAYKPSRADQESTRIVFAQKFVAGNSRSQIEAKDPVPGTTTISLALMLRNG
jgi:hypothetical protein